MNVLVYALTAGELAWACAQAARPSSAGDSWCVVWFNDMISLPVPATGIPTNCKVLSGADLGVDNEQVWRRARQLQAELWQDLPDTPARSLHIGAQVSIGFDVLQLVYAEGAVAAVLQRLNPDEVRVPPSRASRIIRH